MRIESHTLTFALLLLAGFLLSAGGVPRPAHSQVLSCSPAPCTLPPTRASESIATDSPIVTNPLDTKELLLGSVDGTCPPSGGPGFYLSRNGGSTWTRVLCMAEIRHKQLVYIPCDEPSVGYDQKGNAYVAGLYCGQSETGNYGLVAAQRSADGTHWSKPVIALYSPGQTFPYLTHLAADASASSPWAGTVYVSGVMTSDQGSKNQVLVSHSADGGATWTQVAVDSVQVFPEQDEFTRIATGSSGTVYVTWMQCASPCAAGHFMLSKSADGGLTWSKPLRIAGARVAPGLPHTYERVYNYPSIAVDNSNGPYAGNLYVAMYTWTGSYLRVQVIRSTDGGTTWSKPVRLAPKSDTHDQFFPAISVSPTGRVGVSWLDRRNDPNDIDYEAFAAFSDDGGQSFGPNWQLTTAFSNPKNNGTGNNWLGDYTGNTWRDDGIFIAAWMDTSNGSYVDDMVGGVRLK